jgi:hypothetical protein
LADFSGGNVALGSANILFTSGKLEDFARVFASTSSLFIVPRTSPVSTYANCGALNGSAIRTFHALAGEKGRAGLFAVAESTVAISITVTRLGSGTTAVD